MKLFYADGRLYTETGEPIEGIMMNSLESYPDQGVATVNFTLLVEDAPEMSGLEAAVAGLVRLNESLA